MVWLCLAFLATGPEVNWDALIAARVNRHSSALDQAVWQNPAMPKAAREAYFLTLGQIGNPADAARILVAFDDHDVQASAIFAYGELEKAPAEPLLDWLGEVAVDHRPLVIEAFSKLASAEEGEKVVAPWSTLSGAQRDRTLFYLWRLKPESLTEAVIADLKKGNPGALPGHVYYLVRSRTKVEESLLLRLLESPDMPAQTRIYASRVQTESPGKAVEKAMLKLTRHGDWRLRAQGINGLARMKSSKVKRQGLLMLSDTNHNVRRAAITALVQLRDPEVDRNIAAFPQTLSPTLRQTLLANADDSQWPGYWPLVESWEKSESKWEQRQWLNFQGRARTEDVAGRLKSLAASRDSLPTVLAFNALATRDREAALELVPTLMKSDDPFVLNAALGAMSDAEPGQWPVPFASVKQKTDRTYGANIFHHSYLQGLSNWLPDAEAKAELDRMADHSDYLVRYNAVKTMADPGEDDWQKVFKQPWQTPIPKKVLELASEMLTTGKHWTWTLKTGRGDIRIELEPHLAPITCATMAYLSSISYYQDIPIHRVVPNFVVQAGDGRGDGSGGPGFSIPCEVNSLRYRRGAVGMALLSKDSGGSQFFICHSDQPHLDGGYTIFGKVIEGWAVLDQLQEGDVLNWAIIGIEGTQGLGNR